MSRVYGWMTAGLCVTGAVAWQVAGNPDWIRTIFGNPILFWGLFIAQLGAVLGYIEKLKEVDVTGVEPTAHAFPLVNVTRPDEVQPSMDHAEALQNAPAQANGLFLVPKIVD